MQSSPRFAYLDGIRALAIVAVMIVHWGIGRTTIGRGGVVGVDVFFVVSGFVITTVLWRSSSFERPSLGSAYVVFFRARVRRLIPALVGLLVGGSLLMLLPGTGVGFGRAVRNALLTLAQLSWVPEMNGHIAAPFGQTWSLGVEWIFYLTWPVVLLTLRRRGADAANVARGTFIGAVVLSLGTMAAFSGHHFYFNPIGRSGQILLGAALAMWFIARPPTILAPSRARLSTIIACVGTIALVLYCLSPVEPYGAVGRLVGFPLAAIVGALLIHHGYTTLGGPLHALLTHPWVSLVGRCSYSLYLWHWIPLYLLDKDTIPLPTPALAVIGVAMTVGFSWASYRFLELPFLGSRGSMLAPPATADSATDAAPTPRTQPST